MNEHKEKGGTFEKLLFQIMSSRKSHAIENLCRLVLPFPWKCSLHFLYKTLKVIICYVAVLHWPA